jgi:hypothetical protein
MKVIGFGHRSRMGKNTCAEMLAINIRNNGKTVEITSYAKDLKEACYIMFKGFGLQRAEFYELKENEHLRDIKLPDINMTPVEIWVKVGTTLIREQMHDETWIRSTLYERRVDYLIISDVRFMNEVNAIWDLNGKVIKVSNSRTPYKNTKADNALADFRDWNYYIDNDQGLLKLENLMKQLYEVIKI